jgi:hypothetical protein
MNKVISLRPDLYAQAEQLLQSVGRIPVWDDKKQYKRDLNVRTSCGSCKWWSGKSSMVISRD